MREDGRGGGNSSHVLGGGQMAPRKSELADGALRAQKGSWVRGHSGVEN